MKLFSSDTFKTCKPKFQADISVFTTYGRLNVSLVHRPFETQLDGFTFDYQS